MKHNNLNWVAMVLGLGVLSGCFSMGSISGPGDVQGAIPPKIVIGVNQEKIWDNTGSFGPVPSELKAKGDAICRAAGGSRATGYHAKAQNDQGQVFEGGGYYCVKD